MLPKWLSKPAVWSLSNFSSLSHYFIFLTELGFFLPVRKRSTGSTAPLLLPRILYFFLPPSPSGVLVSQHWPQEGWGREDRWKNIQMKRRERQGCSNRNSKTHRYVIRYTQAPSEQKITEWNSFACCVLQAAPVPGCLERDPVSAHSFDFNMCREELHLRCSSPTFQQLNLKSTSELPSIHFYIPTDPM